VSFAYGFSVHARELQRSRMCRSATSLAHRAQMGVPRSQPRSAGQESSGVRPLNARGRLLARRRLLDTRAIAFRTSAAHACAPRRPRAWLNGPQRRVVDGVGSRTDWKGYTERTGTSTGISHGISGEGRPCQSSSERRGCCKRVRRERRRNPLAQRVPRPSSGSKATRVRSCTMARHLGRPRAHVRRLSRGAGTVRS